jgi:hypothetical protein
MESRNQRPLVLIVEDDALIAISHATIVTEEYDVETLLAASVATAEAALADRGSFAAKMSRSSSSLAAIPPVFLWICVARHSCRNLARPPRSPEPWRPLSANRNRNSGLSRVVPHSGRINWTCRDVAFCRSDARLNIRAMAVGG